MADDDFCATCGYTAADHRREAHIFRRADRVAVAWRRVEFTAPIYEGFYPEEDE